MIKVFKKFVGLFVIVFAIVCLTSATFVYADDEVSPPPPPTPTVSIFIRSGGTTIYSGTVDLPTAGNVDIPDHNSVTHSINSDSVLAILYSLAQSNGTFSLSNLDYNSSFNAFYLKCLTSSVGEQCDNWQYAVNDSIPFVGMDSTILSGGESVGIFFGNTHQVIFDKTNVNTNEEFIATAQKYNYHDNSWQALSGVTIGATTPNPDDVWNPIVVKEVAVDGDGKAVFILDSANTYNVGIKEDYYFPSYVVTVNEPSVVVSGGGGGSAIPTKEHHNVDITKMLDFLIAKQKTDGSFGANIYTDWVGVGFGSLDTSNTTGEAMQKGILNLKNYIVTNALVNPSLTDYERRAMVMEVLNVNPYSEGKENYISPILKSFDGTQFGDANLYNDDIFAIIPLLKAGYSSSDIEIKKDVEFILLKQATDGSWGTGVDMTSAGIQALVRLTDLPNVNEAVAKAKVYLKSKQQADGGFGNSISTSWAMGAIVAMGEKSSDWVVGENNPNSYLYGLQQTDGGIDVITTDENSRVWATAYVLPSVLGKDWFTIMHNFPKQEEKKVEIKEEVKNDNKDIKNLDKKPVLTTKTKVHKSNLVVKAESSNIGQQPTIETPVPIKNQNSLKFLNIIFDSWTSFLKMF